MYDYLVKNVRVVDGTGGEPFVADLGIKGGRIARIGALDAAAERLIDGAGLVATPGFVDMHSHSDLAYLGDSTPDQKIRQGVTTEVLGQDGLGVAPVSDAHLDLWATLIGGLQGQIDRERWTWRGFEGYLQALAGRRLPNNAAVLISHGPVRLMALGMDDRPPTERELGEMQRLVRAALAQGACGFSTGLVYPPNSYAATAELVALNREVAVADGVFVVHQRDEGRLLQTAFDEVLTVAERTGVHLHISHLKAYGRAHWKLIDGVLARADAALARGLALSWDRYPYLAGCTMLSAVLPGWTFAQGTAALIRNLADPGFRQRIGADFGLGLEVWNNRALSIGWENVIVSGVTRAENRWMEGQSCAVLARQRGQDPIEFVCDLLRKEELAVTMIAHYGSEQVMDQVLCHPNATVGSDGIYPGTPHPRLYGAFPRYLQVYVREKQRMTWAEAVRKITSAPARILGLRERGELREGYWADIVLLDPETVSDRATYEDPAQYPAGIAYVFVNGQPVVAQGESTGRLAGRVLRR